MKTVLYTGCCVLVERLPLTSIPATGFLSLLRVWRYLGAGPAAASLALWYHTETVSIAWSRVSKWQIRLAENTEE